MAPPLTTSRDAARTPARAIRWLRVRVARSLRRTPAWRIGVAGTLAILAVTVACLVGSCPKDDTASPDSAAPGATDGAAAGIREEPAALATLPFDLPVPETIDTHDPQVREALLSAVQETRELRFVESRDPWLPDLQQVRQQLRQPAAPRVDVACRDPRLRVQMLQREGGTLLTETAVARGLAWLARQQQPDGRWQLDGSVPSDSVATAMALLPFLGACQTHVVGRYQQQLVQGLRWLIHQQGQDGDLRGDTHGHLGMYAQAQAALILCEVLLLTEDPQLREPAQQATDFLLSAQYPDGGWGGRPSWELPVAERRGDTSVLGWTLLALSTARAANLDVPDDAFELASHFLDGVQTRDGAVYPYQRAFPPLPVMTAEALLCRLYLGWGLDSPGLDAGLKLLATDYAPTAEQPSLHYWYHASQVFHHVGGPLWSQWNGRLRELLVRSQETSGETAGSWAPQGEFAAADGRLCSTALAVCILEVYYRHLPVLRQLP